MRKLGSLKGVGALIVGDERIEDVRYEIDVWQEAGGLKSARGTLQSSGNDFFKAFDRNPVVLETADGETLGVTIAHLTLPFGPATIVVNGAVPGF